jgi:hypothetical protein
MAVNKQHKYHSKTVMHFYTPASPARRKSYWNEKSQRQKLTTAVGKMRENGGEADDFQTK